MSFYGFSSKCLGDFTFFFLTRLSFPTSVFIRLHLGFQEGCIIIMIWHFYASHLVFIFIAEYFDRSGYKCSSYQSMAFIRQVIHVDERGMVSSDALRPIHRFYFYFWPKISVKISFRLNVLFGRHYLNTFSLRLFSHPLSAYSSVFSSWKLKYSAANILAHS